MDTPITRAEHEEFARRMEAENKRLSEEDKRQNHRLDVVEDTVRQIGSLTVSVEKLAVSMEGMLKEQAEQGRRLGALESQDEINALSANIERIAAAMETQGQCRSSRGKSWNGWNPGTAKCGGR